MNDKLFKKYFDATIPSRKILSEDNNLTKNGLYRWAKIRKLIHF